MLMPFGKFRGQPVSSLDTGYLTWLTENVSLREPLLSAVNREIQSRAALDPCNAFTLRISPDLSDLAKEVFHLGFKQAALRHHPDKGGNQDTMKDLNRLREAVTSQWEAVR
jgi:hypothetical protein